MAARSALLSPYVDPLSLPPDELRRLGHHVWDRLVDRWEQLDSQPPISPVDPTFDQRAIPPCPDGPRDPQKAIDALFDEFLPRGQRADHPRFFARVGSPSNPVSVLADLIGMGHNAFAGSWTGGAASRRSSSPCSTGCASGWGCRTDRGRARAGGSVGTLTALAAAAHERIDDRDQATAYLQEHTHAAVAKAWRISASTPRTCASSSRSGPSPPAGRDRRGAAARPPGRARAVRRLRHGRDDQHRLGRPAQRPRGPRPPRRPVVPLDGAYGAPARLTPPATTS